MGDGGERKGAVGVTSRPKPENFAPKTGNHNAEFITKNRNSPVL
jgi:hypothetical protein